MSHLTCLPYALEPKTAAVPDYHHRFLAVHLECQEVEDENAQLVVQHQRLLHKFVLVCRCAVVGLQPLHPNESSKVDCPAGKKMRWVRVMKILSSRQLILHLEVQGCNGLGLLLPALTAHLH